MRVGRILSVRLTLHPGMVPSFCYLDGMRKFTLRFDDGEDRLHEELALVADQLGMSMNTLAKDLIGRQLRSYSVVAQKDLEDTLVALRDLTDADVERSIGLFAEAEGSVAEPIQARKTEVVAPESVASQGIAAVFGR